MRRAIAFALLLALAPAGARAETVRAAVAAFPPTLGNPFSGASQPSSEMWLSVFDGVTRLGWTGGPEPGLALSWTNTSPTTWRFMLRPGVTFHNGKPFTAQDVVDVLALLKRPEMARYLIAAELQSVRGARAIDPMTVEIETAEPDAILPNRLAVMMIVDVAAWDGAGVDAFTRAPVGTGPFRLTAWREGTALAVLGRHAGSWRAPAEVSRLEYRLVPDKTARLQSLISRQTDVVTGLHVDDVATVEGMGLKALVFQNPQIKSIALPNLHAGDHPLKDVRVRQALNFAVDKDSIARHIMLGFAEPAGQGAGRDTFGFNPEVKPYPYDPARAKALLIEAGYPDGFDMRIEVVVDNATPDALLYQQVAQDLAAVGVRVTLGSITFADYSRKYAAADWGEADAFHLIWNNAAFQDPIRAIEYFSCLKVNPFFCEDSLVPEIRASSRELSRDKREKMLQGIMARLHDLAPAIWLTNSVYTVAHSPRIEVFEMRPTGIVFENIGFGIQ
ncbi:MAG: ABC transporter substrate-binding protein [Rhodospirillaceae bacterium]|nr:ABC transporter substrate-binding protein [Rhodospirillaceae bacterium]